jgi:hypothetical protein
MCCDDAVLHYITYLEIDILQSFWCFDLVTVEDKVDFGLEVAMPCRDGMLFSLGL